MLSANSANGSTISVQLTSSWHGSAYVQIFNTIYHISFKYITYLSFFFLLYIYSPYRYIYIYISFFFFSVTWRDSFVQFMHVFVTVSLLRFFLFVFLLNRTFFSLSLSLSKFWVISLQNRLSRMFTLNKSRECRERRISTPHLSTHNFTRERFA